MKATSEHGSFLRHIDEADGRGWEDTDFMRLDYPYCFRSPPVSTRPDGPATSSWTRRQLICRLRSSRLNSKSSEVVYSKFPSVEY